MADDEIILDEIDLTSNDGEDAALNFTPLAEFGQGRENIPGIIAGVAIEEEEESAWAEDGILHIPQGRINSVAAADSWRVDNGNIYIGRANGNSAGVISGVSIERTTSKTPIITSGMIKIPLAQAYDGAESTSPDTAGAIKGIEYVDGICLGIVDGVIRLPKSPVFPAGLYDAVNGKKIPWATFLAGTSPVPMSVPKSGPRIMAFHLDNYLTFYLEDV